MEWLEETLHPGWHQKIKVEEVLFRERTEFQDLVIFQSRDWGRVLALDGVVQTTEGDEFIYHEMIAHVPMLAHGAARDVLIIGGGDGGTLREVVKHKGLDRCVMVELDPGVVELSRAHLPSLSAGAFDDPKAELMFADGVKFVAETDRRFDVIIVDSTDPIGPGEVLFTEAFYRDCRRILAPGGVLVTQNGVVMVQAEEVENSTRRLGASFDAVTFYAAAVPTYIGGLMTFGFASDRADRAETPVATLEGRLRDSGIQGLRHYTPRLHHGAFALPAWVEALVERSRDQATPFRRSA